MGNNLYNNAMLIKICLQILHLYQYEIQHIYVQIEYSTIVTFFHLFLRYSVSYL